MQYRVEPAHPPAEEATYASHSDSSDIFDFVNEETAEEKAQRKADVEEKQWGRYFEGVSKLRKQLGWTEGAKEEAADENDGNEADDEADEDGDDVDQDGDVEMED
jgi:hypothetical protein